MMRSFREFRKRICPARCWVLAAAAMMLGGNAAADSVVLQGYQVQKEQYAANTADAYVDALKMRPGQVVALRPKSQPGWAGGEAYTNKAELLSRLRVLATGSTDFVLVLVGDADGPAGTFRVGADAGATADEIADVLTGAKSVSLVSAGCNTMAETVASHLTNVSIAISGITQEKSAHTWPEGDRGQFDLYSRALISSYYLLAGQSTPSISALLGQAHRAARRATIKMSGGRQQPTRLSSDVQASGAAGAAGAIVALGNRDYSFYLQLLADGRVSGYVANALGLPVSPVQSAKRASDVVSFSFSERGRTVNVTARDLDGVPGVTIDGSSANFTYLTTRVALVSSGRHLGAAYVVSGLAGAPRVMVALESGQQVTNVSYDSESQSIGLKIPDNNGVLDASLTFGRLGDVQVAVGDTQYSASSVLRYGLYGADGNLEASIVGVLSDGQLKGELLPVNSEMRLPLTSSLAKDGLTGAASLVGNTFTLTGGAVWSSTRPPAKGRLQSSYFDLPTVRDVYADATSESGRVDVSWDIETSAMSSALLLGDLRFQVVRIDRFNNLAKAFDVPAGRKQYADRPEGDPKAYDYAVRPVLDHRVTTCSDTEPLSLVGLTVVAISGPPVQTQPPQPMVAAVASGLNSPAPAAGVADVAMQAPDAKQAPDVKQAEEQKKDREKKAKEEDRKRAEAVRQKEKDEEGLRKLREMRKGEGLKGKIVYGLLGAFLLIGLAIAVGGGGSPSPLEPN